MQHECGTSALPVQCQCHTDRVPRLAQGRAPSTHISEQRFGRPPLPYSRLPAPSEDGFLAVAIGGFFVSCLAVVPLKETKGSELNDFVGAGGGPSPRAVLRRSLTSEGVPLLAEAVAAASTPSTEASETVEAGGVLGVPQCMCPTRR